MLASCALLTLTLLPSPAPDDGVVAHLGTNKSPDVRAVEMMADFTIEEHDAAIEAMQRTAATLQTQMMETDHLNKGLDMLFGQVADLTRDVQLLSELVTRDALREGGAAARVETLEQEVEVHASVLKAFAYVVVRNTLTLAGLSQTLFVVATVGFLVWGCRALWSRRRRRDVPAVAAKEDETEVAVVEAKDASV